MIERLDLADCIVITLFVAMTSGAYGNNSGKDVKDYCEGETFRARCSYDEVITMQVATYGRMKLGRCVKFDMGYLGCKQNVIDLADDRCSGRRMCDIPIPDTIFEATQPCLELKSYFEASYTCVKVLTVETTECRGSRPLRARLPSGRIASLTAQESRCASRQDTTWSIQGAPGQRVNISMLDFNAAAHILRRQPASSQLPSAHFEQPCHKYATIIEPDDHTDSLGQTGRTTLVCGRRARWQHVYTSTGHVVHLQFESHRVSPDYFILSYEVFGCSDPPIVGNLWFKRTNDDEAEMGCRVTSDKWRVVCVDQEWKGNYVNCSHFETFELAVRSTSADTSSNAGVLTSVLCVCVFVIAVAVVIVGILVRRRHLRQQRPKNRRGTSAANSKTSTSRKSTSREVGHQLDSRSKVEEGTADAGSEDYDDHADMASYVWPSKDKREHYGRQRSTGESVGTSVGYDVVDGCGSTRSSDVYEKVSSCRYEHIWQMPLPKAPDE